MSKKDCQRSHFKRRVFERYEITINDGEYDYLVSRVKKARLFYRSFDPNEQPRLSAHDAIQNVAQSFGVIVPLRPDSYVDARIHNLRAAFLAGLAQGMDKKHIVLQPSDDPVPLDYRDFVRICRSPEDIDREIADFAPLISEIFQSDLKEA